MGINLDIRITGQVLFEPIDQLLAVVPMPRRIQILRQIKTAILSNL